MKYKPTLPSKWNKDLAYLFGLLLGDGCLPKTSSRRKNGTIQKRYMIYFSSNSIEFQKEVFIPLFKNIFSLTPRLCIMTKNRINPLYECRIESQEVYNLLIKKGFTNGKKARIAKIPNLPNKYKIYLLAGLLDTDGGKKGSGFGYCTASKNLAEFCEEMFKQFNIKYSNCPWTYRNHTYHQIYAWKNESTKVLKNIPIKHKDKIAFIKNLSASVA